MILDLRKLKRSGKDWEEFSFNYSPEIELLDIPNAKISLPLKVNGTVTLNGEHAAIVEGEIIYKITGECTRCLEQTEREYVAEFYESVEPNNPDGYEVKNDTVDLRKIVEDTVAINVPLNFLCKEDCKGICVDCGTNLNHAECKCKK